MNTLKLAAASSLLFWGAAAQAIGLGDINLYSALNDPLRAEIEVHGATSQSIKAELLTSSIFTNADVVRQFDTTSVEFAYNANNNPVIVLTGQIPFTEPFLHFSLSVHSDSDKKRTREYTVLLDPPGTTFRPRAALTSSPVIAAIAPSETTPELQHPVTQSQTAPWLPADGGIDIDLTTDSGIDIDLHSELDGNSNKPMINRNPALEPEPFPVRGQTSELIPVPAHVQ
ncbi:hypothetical protein AB833_24580 [Chromatiales bacterium (ex Bugula neritina AB1)]|nr:hypothetical protein AB833_24580 [Chromatiales bacterium (ex Bugula neritina AB1)]